MRIRFLRAVVTGQTEQSKPIIDSVPDVPEQFRHDGVPAWAGTYKLKRHLFNWISMLGRARMQLRHPAPDTYLFEVKVPIFKDWSFAVTPELSYLVANIATNVNNEAATDIEFIFRGRKFFIPFELLQQFCVGVQIIIRNEPDRVGSLHAALHGLQVLAEAEDGEQQGTEVKRVLH